MGAPRQPRYKITETPLGFQVKLVSGNGQIHGIHDEIIPTIREAEEIVKDCQACSQTEGNYDWWKNKVDGLYYFRILKIFQRKKEKPILLTSGGYDRMKTLTQTMKRVRESGKTDIVIIERLKQ